MRPITKQVADFIEGLSYEKIPGDVILKIKACILDTLGCAIAGNSAPETRTLIDGLFEPEERDAGAGFIWVDAFPATINTSILVNSAMSHAVELDDLHKSSKTHPGAVIIPTVLTAGAARHINGKDALTSIVAGYEVTIRLGEGVGTVSHRRRGWHATATCGTFGAAAAYSKILGLDSNLIRNALGLAGTQAAGLFAFLNDGSLCKRFQVGKAAQNGWISAKLAEAGLTGSTVILEAEEGGYLKAVSDEYYFDKITEGLGNIYKTADIGLKSYACCGHTHQGIFAAICLKKEYGIVPENVESAVVRTYGVSGLNWGICKMPENSVEGQFNFPFVIALALTDGQVFLKQFTEEKLKDPKINELATRIKVEIDDRLTVLYPSEWCSNITIKMKDGKEYFKEVIGAKGDPQNPMTKEEVEEKFRALTDGIISEEQQDKICAAVDNFENLNDIGELVTLLIKS